MLQASKAAGIVLSDGEASEIRLKRSTNESKPQIGNQPNLWSLTQHNMRKMQICPNINHGSLQNGVSSEYFLDQILKHHIIH